MAWEVKAGRNAREVSSTKTRCFLGVRLMEKTTPSRPPRRALHWSAKMASGSAAVLERLRGAMRSSKYVSEPLTAYIILTDDAHQVRRSLRKECRNAWTTKPARVVDHTPS